MATDELNGKAEETPTSHRERTVWAIHIRIRGREWVIGMNRPDSAPLTNAILPKGGSRWRSFGAGAIMQALFVCFILMLPLLFPDRVVELRRFVAMEIAPTSQVVRAEQPLRRRPRRLRLEAAKTVGLPVEIPQIPSPVSAIPALRPRTAVITPAAPQLSIQSAIPRPIPNSDIPRLKKPREPVRLGGFGAPSEPFEASSNARPNATPIGEFASLSRASSGSDRSAHAMVREGQFVNQHPPISAQRIAPAPGASSRSKPVEILFKPTPEYTKAALAKKVEGDVYLEVLFASSGEVTVLQVVKGLGYGLDQTAIEAAREIRFRPAHNQAGEPIDSTARVRIAFELAY
jgi:TonB family protein